MSGLFLRGTLTALVTPFTADGSAVAWDAWEAHVEAQIVGGVTGLVPCGTTGETPTLTDAEQLDLVRRAVSVAAGRVPVVAGTGLNSTKKTIEASRAALEAGANGVMIVMPYYNRPSQDGMRVHVEEVARAVAAPVILYNIPARTGVELSVETCLRILDSSKNVLAVKDATNNVHWCQKILAAAGDRVAILSGDDALTVPMMSVGARGVISVTSNVLPREVSAVTTAALEGRWDDARRLHLALLAAHTAMFLEPNPVPAKVALAAQGRMTAAVRLPLVAASEESRTRILGALESFGEKGRS